MRSKSSYVLFKTVVHFDTWYNKKSLIYWAIRESSMFCDPETGDPQCFPRAQ